MQLFTPTITLQVNSTGWYAEFQDVSGMPDARLPLPFTVQAMLPQVAADIRKRFPKARLFVRFCDGHRSHCGV